MSGVTLIAPTLNELACLKVILPKIDPRWVDELIVADGHSTDGTIEYCREAGVRVHVQSGTGYGAAIREVLAFAKGDIVIEFPADGSSMPEKIPELTAKIREGYDLVIASRYLGGAKSYDDDCLTAFGNKMFTGFINFLFGSSYTDSMVGYRAYRRASFDKLRMDTPGLGWGVQSSIQFVVRGFKVTEIAADEPKRIAGVRKMRPFRTGWEILMLILREFVHKND